MSYFNKGEFVVIPNKHIIKGKKGYIQSVYMWICDHSDENGMSFPSRKTLADEAGCEIQSVDKALKELEKIGILEKKIRKNNLTKENFSNLYRVVVKNLPPSSENPTPPSSENPTVTQPIINSTHITQATDKQSQEIPFVIKSFEKVDPKNKKYYGNKTQRNAADFLIKEYGIFVVIDVIENILPITNKRPRYEFPHISTPYSLMENWIKVKDGIQTKQQEKQESKEKYKVFKS